MKNGVLHASPGGRAAFDWQDGAEMPAEHSPRPFVHPLWTPDGRVASDQSPADHPWHLGLCCAFSDVGGVNFWGGPSYEAGAGYVWRENHGRQELVEARPWRRREAGLEGVRAVVLWRDREGRTLLREERELGARPAEGGAWALFWSGRLENVAGRELRLASPACSGRAGAGYGGVVWRGAPEWRGGRMFTAEHEGDAVNGARGGWLAFAGPGAALLFVAPTAVEWFARSEPYAIAGTAPCAKGPLVLDVGESLRCELALRVLVGAPGRAECEEGAEATRRLGAEIGWPGTSGD